jgi:hypothetical protein
VILTLAIGSPTALRRRSSLYAHSENNRILGTNVIASLQRALTGTGQAVHAVSELTVFPEQYQPQRPALLSVRSTTAQIISPSTREVHIYDDRVILKVQRFCPAGWPKLARSRQPDTDASCKQDRCGVTPYQGIHKDCIKTASSIHYHSYLSSAHSYHDDLYDIEIIISLWRR